jgi:hypothetical protein
MSPEEIPDDVFAFIEQRIDSVPQLEALLLLWGDPTRAWSTPELAARIYVELDVAARVLEALERRQLARVSPEPGERYVYDPAWDASGKQMTRIAEAYRRHVVLIATFIHSGASPAVREFARAFDFKKKDR